MWRATGLSNKAIKLLSLSYSVADYHCLSDGLHSINNINNYVVIDNIIDTNIQQPTKLNFVFVSTHGPSSRVNKGGRREEVCFCPFTVLDYNIAYSSTNIEEKLPPTRNI